MYYTIIIIDSCTENTISIKVNVYSLIRIYMHSRLINTNYVTAM